ncbi:hypothetical protein [Streptomyces avermitilis]|uniref:hypothetical protein n=1 Tax=Streptomyces avermitilis TaxID=33903 RepID=UPI0036B1473A
MRGAGGHASRFGRTLLFEDSDEDHDADEPVSIVEYQAGQHPHELPPPPAPNSPPSSGSC